MIQKREGEESVAKVERERGEMIQKRGGRVREEKKGERVGPMFIGFNLVQ
jgi:hypothetical protein